MKLLLCWGTELDAEETHFSTEHWGLGTSGQLPVTAKAWDAGTVLGKCCGQIPTCLCEAPLPLYKGSARAGCSDTVAYAIVATTLAMSRVSGRLSVSQAYMASCALEVGSDKQGLCCLPISVNGAQSPWTP